MRLQTPEKIRTLQRKLYLKAKAEPDFRFYLLYDKVYREDILFHAYRLARSNKGAPGVDGQSFEEIEAMGLEGWLSGIRDDLRAKTYRPEPVRRAMVPKPGGGERPLGIPTIRDRVVQGAVKLVIEPIFEADLEPSAYGYRPKRSAGDAVQAVHKLLCRGYTDVVDADLSKYFDTIPHAELMQSVARRIVDRNVLRLIKLWLKTPVEETDGDGKRRMTGGRGSTRETATKSVVAVGCGTGFGFGSIGALARRARGTDFSNGGRGSGEVVTNFSTGRRTGELHRRRRYRRGAFKSPLHLAPVAVGSLRASRLWRERWSPRQACASGRR